MRFMDPIPGRLGTVLGQDKEQMLSDDEEYCTHPLSNINVAKTFNLTRHLTFQAICPARIEKTTKDNQHKPQPKHKHRTIPTQNTKHNQQHHKTANTF